MDGSRILVVRVGALGDTLLAFPALFALRRAAGPKGAVELLGTLPAARLALNDQHASAIHSFDRALFGGFFQACSWDDPLARFLASFDHIVTWSNLPRLRALAPARAILEGSPRPPSGKHASDHLLQSLAPLGIEPAVASPSLVISEASRRDAEGFLGRGGSNLARFIAIHPSSGSVRKNWPAERFVSVARRASDSGLAVVWIEGESDAEIVRAVSRCAPGIVARLELDVLAALLTRAALYLGNDSGVSHLAAAAGAPTLVLFGPTDPDTWSPRGRIVRVVNWQLSSRVVWGKACEMLRPH